MQYQCSPKKVVLESVHMVSQYPDGSGLAFDQSHYERTPPTAAGNCRRFVHSYVLRHIKFCCSVNWINKEPMLFKPWGLFLKQNTLSLPTWLFKSPIITALKSFWLRNNISFWICSSNSLISTYFCDSWLASTDKYGKQNANLTELDSHIYICLAKKIASSCIARTYMRNVPPL